MKLTVLGSGSPEPYVRRASSGYLLEVGDDCILLDCGGGVVDNLIRSGRTPKDVTHLFFTHYHSDHMIDYARLVHAAWDEGAPPLKVFGPKPLVDMTKSIFGRDGMLGPDLRARTELPQSQQVWVARGGKLPRALPAPVLSEITHGFVFDGEGWRLAAASASHAEPVLECLGFAVECDNKKFVYSGDTGINPNITELCQNADFLLHWCYRGQGEELHPALDPFCPSPSDIAEMAKNAGVKRLFLTHFRKHMDSKDGHKSAMRELQALFADNAGIVEDLDVYDI